MLSCSNWINSQIEPKSQFFFELCKIVLIFGPTRVLKGLAVKQSYNLFFFHLTTHVSGLSYQILIIKKDQDIPVGLPENNYSFWGLG